MSEIFFVYIKSICTYAGIPPKNRAKIVKKAEMAKQSLKSG